MLHNERRQVPFQWQRKRLGPAHMKRNSGMLNRGMSSSSAALFVCLCVCARVPKQNRKTARVGSCQSDEISCDLPFGLKWSCTFCQPIGSLLAISSKWNQSIMCHTRSEILPSLSWAVCFLNIASTGKRAFPKAQFILSSYFIVKHALRIIPGPRPYLLYNVRTTSIFDIPVVVASNSGYDYSAVVREARNFNILLACCMFGALALLACCAYLCIKMNNVSVNLSCTHVFLPSITFNR